MSFLILCKLKLLGSYHLWALTSQQKVEILIVITSSLCSLDGWIMVNWMMFICAFIVFMLRDNKRFGFVVDGGLEERKKNKRGERGRTKKRGK
ncbi:hypothetical protein RchiOBHm_Chr2g0116301 [Rosa chinensis]|uniref:Uncharacterized protein n=1 Tax=Rosa chinensis TaxID=74649 RepID=A0A2P6RR73_ROSCH|nr:hypothetical protein RchiOBHm_Chr2g0116301 [Rosa chinensis]